MKPREPQWLLHPLFLSCLFLLLLNDLSLKYVFHNAFTGKLSDFAGLIVFSMFLVAYRPEHRKRILLVVAIFFCWWKSPLSQPLIDMMNNTLPVRIARVVDYSDLLALFVLPLVNLILSGIPPTKSSSPVFLVRFIGIVSLFAFCNTSDYRRVMYELPDDELSLNESFYTTMTEDQVLGLLSPEGSGWRRDSIKYFPARQADFFYRIQQDGDSIARWAPLTNKKDSAIYVQQRQYGYFYVIKSFTLEGRVFKNLEFKYYPGKKKNTVSINSFVLAGYNRYKNPLSNKELKKIKKQFKALFNARH